MAPEIDGKNAYDGPPVDIFAMGHILFIMATTMFCFNEAGDRNYERFQRNPEETYARKKLKFSKDLLDLIVGMTKEDPA